MSGVVEGGGGLWGIEWMGGGLGGKWGRRECFWGVGGKILRNG